MKLAPKGVKKYLPTAIITTLTIFALSFLLTPISKILAALLSRFSSNSIELLIFQLMVGLSIVILGLVSYIIHLRQKLKTKRIFRFGVYWHKDKPYCPYCGERLVETPFEFLGCSNCEEKINLCNDKTKTFLIYKDALKIIRRET